MYKKFLLAISLLCSLHGVVKAAEHKCYRLSQVEYRQLKKYQALQISTLQRIRNLELLYKELEKIMDSFNYAVKVFKSVLGISDAELNPLEEAQSKTSYEHISGVIMDPGYVSFEIKTRLGETFDELGLKDLEFDIYHNANLFEIERIEGDKVFGDEFQTLSLSQKTRAAKTRIKLPISDVLSDSVTFRVYLAPRDFNQIQVADTTSLDIRYYKRISRDEEAPLILGFVEGSARHIKVAVK